MDIQEKAVLKEKIQNHPLWEIPAEERQKNKALFWEFGELVLKYKKFYDVLAEPAHHANHILQCETEYRTNVLNNPAHRTAWFDAAAFTQALIKAVRWYRPVSENETNMAGFLTYFDKIYSQELTKEAIKMTTIAEQTIVSPKELSLLKEISHCMQRLFPDEKHKTLPLAQCTLVAGELNRKKESGRRWTAESVYSLLHATQMVLSFDERTDDDTDGTTPFQPESPVEESPTVRAEDLMFISWFFDNLRPDAKTTKKRNQIRALLTNDVLRPLHPQNDGDYVEQIDIYRSEFCKHGEQLYKQIFTMEPSGNIDYLVYLEWYNPTSKESVPVNSLKQIRMLCSAEPSLPLQDKTAANYFNVNNLSPARQLCNALMQDLRAAWG